ncbi:SAF domain protein [Beutenbergia cavernae DSM 12333]|uniref:SAF domain protein n=1 Tax=Beutenbergia cavernae (strain ATCC BAA-8 / DSM 12333 / CCUG 43141 / JCM 11478 / NBRC 16432 / NCIMB 13614 / HKI 0122) TaxID=471853 RepID=C5C1P9_BEUC1|nr:SAF domain-containing protein [Beutenbergia cavernae]ACQ79517.1 SAF domain protein [Beutenbergia cavernae DSM 12333]
MTTTETRPTWHEGTTTRVRRPSWRDPRLGVGLLLVAASVALGTWAVQAADESVAVYAATDDLAPGDRLDADDLTVRQIRWDGEGGTYLLAEDGVPDDVVVTRPVGAGELVPSSATGPADAVDTRPVAMPVPAGSGIGAGVHVDVWAVPPSSTGDDGDEAAVPELVVENVLVASVTEDDTLFASSSGQVARVLVPADQVGDVLAVTAAGGSTLIVERPGG